MVLLNCRYLEQHCGKVIHPSSGFTNPSEGTRLVLRDNRDAGALFYYDIEKEHFVHIGGKAINPASSTPGYATQLRLQSAMGHLTK